MSHDRMSKLLALGVQFNLAPNGDDGGPGQDDAADGEDDEDDSSGQSHQNQQQHQQQQQRWRQQSGRNRNHSTSSVDTGAVGDSERNQGRNTKARLKRDDDEAT